MITAYINFSELPSWLAMNPVEKLVAETGVQVEWKPVLRSLGNLVNSNLKPGEEDPLAAYKARRAKARHRAAKRENERMCELLGIKAEQGEREFDPLHLSLGLLWVSEQAPSRIRDYIEAAFREAFSKQGPVESGQDVTGIINRIDIATDGFEQFAADNREAVEASREETLDSGILNAPAFIVDGEIFHGREHLPLITWMLTGRQGVPPV